MKNSKIIQRLQVVEAAQQLGIGKAAELFKINRKTVGGWLAKYLELGLAGLQSNYAAKKVQPQGMTDAESAKILALKTANPTISAARIKAELALPYSLTAINKKIRSSSLSSTETGNWQSLGFKDLQLFCGKNRLIDGYEFRFVLTDLISGANYYAFSNEYSRNSVINFLLSFLNSQNSAIPVRILHNLPFIKTTVENGLLLTKNSAKRDKTAVILLEKLPMVNSDQNLTCQKFSALQLWHNFDSTQNQDDFSDTLPLFQNHAAILVSEIIIELGELATAFIAKNQLQFAASALKAAIYLAKKNCLAETEVELLLKISRFQQKNGEMENAKNSIGKAIELAASQQLTALKVKAYGIYGIMLQSAGNNRAAAIYLNKQYKESCEIALKSEQIQAALSLGVLYNNLGNYAKSLAFYQQVIELSKNSGQKAQKLTALGNIGVIYWRKNKIMQALEYFKAALNMAVESCNSRQMARMYGNIGAVYDEMHNPVQAQIFYEKQLKLAIEIRNESLQSAALANLGGIYQSAGNYKQALELLNNALLLAEKRADKEKKAVILGEIAAIYYKTGSILPALTQINRAIQLSLATGESYYLSSFYLQKAEIYFKQSKLNQAKKYLQLADAAFCQSERADLRTEYAILKIKTELYANPPQLLSELENLWQHTRSADDRKDISAEIIDYASPLNQLPPPEKHSAYISQYQRKLQKKSDQTKN